MTAHKVEPNRKCRRSREMEQDVHLLSQKANKMGGQFSGMRLRLMEGQYRAWCFAVKHKGAFSASHLPMDEGRVLLMMILAAVVAPQLHSHGL